MFHSFRLRERFRFRRLDNRPLFHFIMIINISNPYRNLALYWNTAISVLYHVEEGKNQSMAQNGVLLFRVEY